MCVFHHLCRLRLPRSHALAYLSTLVFVCVGAQIQWRADHASDNDRVLHARGSWFIVHSIQEGRDGSRWRHRPSVHLRHCDVNCCGRLLLGLVHIYNLVQVIGGHVPQLEMLVQMNLSINITIFYNHAHVSLLGVVLQTPCHLQTRLWTNNNMSKRRCKAMPTPSEYIQRGLERAFECGRHYGFDVQTSEPCKARAAGVVRGQPTINRQSTKHVL